jgi:ABC-type sugar transport system substrate-binding protein
MLAASYRRVSRRTVFVGLFALSASGPHALAQAKPRRFAVAIPDTRRLYYQRMLTGMSGAAKPLGIELHVEEYAYDTEKELLVVETLIQQGFDGYIVVSTGTDGADSELASILQKIPAPFATVGNRILGAAVTVLPDWRSAGTLQAQLATKFAPAGSTLLYLTLQTDYGVEASRAFQVAVKETQSAAIVLIINSFSREEAIDRTFNALAADPHVAVIAASTDQLGLWAAEAAAKAGRQVKVIGLGASEEGLAGIGAGSLAGTIDLNPDAQGSAAVKGLAPVAEKHLCDNGQKPICPEELIQPRTITSAALPPE